MSAPAANNNHIIFNATIDGTHVNNVSSPVEVTQMIQMSFQVKSDGGAAATIDVQKSNVGYRINGFTVPRDDSYASTDWVTIFSANMMAGSVTSDMYDLPMLMQAGARVRITRTSGSGNFKVIYFTQGNS